jgi:hypothetical protein
MPGESGVTVVTTLVCFVSFRTRGCGRNTRPAFPVPSEFRGQDLPGKTRAQARRDREAVSANGLFENLIWSVVPANDVE